jgi:hypothetical protein
MPNPSDGRSYLVVLTGEGLAAHRDAGMRFELAYRAFVDALPEDERLASQHLADLRGAVERAIATLARGTATAARK